MTFSLLPILIADTAGSVAMVVIALMSLYKARRLREMDRDNAVFLYLLWISTGFTLFALSRSFGHILKQFLELTAHAQAWHAISAYSGSINTATFMLVGLITLFFNQTWKINEKIEIEQQIAQADKLAALGELSAGVAHAINNPLGIILGYTQLLLKQETGQGKADLEIIEKHVKNCRQVVTDLLAFSRKDSDSPGVIDITEIIENVTHFLSNHSDFQNIEMTFTPCRRDTLKILGSEQGLSQVLVNLIINACHATRKAGRIDIITRKTLDKNALIIVKDNGRGIEKKNLARIFDPFFTTKPPGQGTGLGLSVGYGIIKQHNGTIKVKSHTGRGSVFTISLPIYASNS
ncbi:MAG: ATP-binding protein [Desulfobacteraceae bacterium]